MHNPVTVARKGDWTSVTLEGERPKAAFFTADRPVVHELAKAYQAIAEQLDPIGLHVPIPLTYDIHDQIDGHHSETGVWAIHDQDGFFVRYLPHTFWRLSPRDAIYCGVNFAAEAWGYARVLQQIDASISAHLRERLLAAVGD